MSKVYVYVDIDGVCAHVGNRFEGIEVPACQERGNPEFEAYLDKVQAPEALMKDAPVAGMQAFVAAFPDAVYLTSRDEKYRWVTEKWLNKNNFPERELKMRPNGNQQKAAEFKQDLIQQRTGLNSFGYPGAKNVIVIDDDPSEALEKICLKEGWTMLKAKSGGSAV